MFTTELGRPVYPRNLLRVVETAAKAAGVETDLHTIRHSDNDHDTVVPAEGRTRISNCG